MPVSHDGAVSRGYYVDIEAFSPGRDYVAQEYALPETCHHVVIVGNKEPMIWIEKSDLSTNRPYIGLLGRFQISKT